MYPKKDSKVVGQTRSIKKSFEEQYREGWQQFFTKKIASVKISKNQQDFRYPSELEQKTHN